jgi:hypothetical protein
MCTNSRIVTVAATKGFNEISFVQKDFQLIEFTGWMSDIELANEIKEKATRSCR